MAVSDYKWAKYIERYRKGQWRSPIFHDMILDEVRGRPGELTFLDIGCGSGFDNDVELQKSLASHAGRYIGIEPDPEIDLGPDVDEVHRCVFEEAELEPGSVDLAFASFVLEHVPDPKRFWEKLYKVLAEDGVFWGFTVDGRHPFSIASRTAEVLRLKSMYFRWLHRDTGMRHFEHYPAYYRANTPRQISRYTKSFSQVDFSGFHRVGQLDYYFPRFLRGVSHLADRVTIAGGLPGSVLLVRLQK